MSARVILAATTIAGGAFVLAVAVTAGASFNGPTPVGVGDLASCTAAGPIPGLSNIQAGNAETIGAVAEGMPAGSPLAARMALMAAYTESRFVDLGPVAGTDSLGLFQQRASQGWGTPAQEEDPAEATAMFVSALLDLPGWQALPPWEAVQDVQRSAFADGSNYEGNWDIAGRILSAVDDLTGGGADCGELLGATPAGPAARFGLPVGYSIPVAVDPSEATALSYALAQLGKPYVWGAAGPAEFDCSGLTMEAWATAGITLLHNTVDQMAEGESVVNLSTISPGDLVLIPGSDGTLAAPGHVGIYIGYGLVESAVDPAQGVIVQTWASFTVGGLSGIRHIG